MWNIIIICCAYVKHFHRVYYFQAPLSNIKNNHYNEAWNITSKIMSTDCERMGDGERFTQYFNRTVTRAFLKIQVSNGEFWHSGLKSRLFHIFTKFRSILSYGAHSGIQRGEILHLFPENSLTRRPSDNTVEVSHPNVPTLLHTIERKWNRVEKSNTKSSKKKCQLLILKMSGGFESS